LENRVQLDKETVEENKRKKGILEAIKEAVREAKPDLKFAGAAVFELGKEHAVVLLLDEEENPLGDILIDLKEDIAVKNPKEFKVKIKSEPQGMLHYELVEDGHKYEGKAILLSPWISYREIYSK
jgi:hypothetical protein